MTRDDVQRWLDRYVDAWRTYEPAAIAALFTEEATYAYQPWADPLRGRQEIVDDWLANRDEPGSWEADYRALLVDGNRAVATGETRYADGKVYSNLFVFRLTEDGRCIDFTEWYMLRPAG